MESDLQRLAEMFQAQVAVTPIGDVAIVFADGLESERDGASPHHKAQRAKTQGYLKPGHCGARNSTDEHLKA